ncbi:hypothetical protein [Photobacterium sanguinicancri]|uniref:DUF3987 domain-containing protein n=1 Tax=Photobacterium sanguinicancri TaxID=875932 RepID=A0AAW7YAJ8_9GAMM|nr:hypothetical protein [Photobacterium sanguinicancri]MDO6543685.1 hypothetical protein [Photobacterium sanguinicancri]
MLKRFFGIDKSKKQLNESSSSRVGNKYNNDKLEFDRQYIEPIKIRPTLDIVGHYGLVGRFMNELSSGTESIKEFIGIELISYIAVSIERGNIYVPYGANKTIPRLNSLLVAATGIGKGISSKQFNPVKEMVNKKYENLLCPEHNGGLSTTEGLVNAIRDDNEDANGEVIKGIKDKRLFVIEEEFVNVLTQGKKGNSTLSSTIRCLFDGGELAPLTKFNQISCKEPHVSIFAHITAEELHSELKPVDLKNGFMNRFPIYYGMKQPNVPFPEAISTNELEELAIELSEVIIWCNSDKRQMIYSDCYKALWEEKYSYLRNLGAEDSLERSLMVRARHYASMYAMVFAAMDLTIEMTAKHLEAALAWIDYWHQSVKYIYSTELDEIKAEHRKEVAKEVFKAIKKAVEANSGKAIGKTILTKKFSGRYSSQEISDALKYMQELPEPPIKVTLLPRNKHEISLV